MTRRGGRMAILSSLAVLIVALFAASDGATQPAGGDGKRAAELFDEGTGHYQAGNYDLAIEKFREGHQLSGDPNFLFNIAVALRKQGNCAEAARHYRDYLAAVPNTQDRAQIEGRIAEMDACAEREAGDEKGSVAAPDSTGPTAALSDRAGSGEGAAPGDRAGSVAMGREGPQPYSPSRPSLVPWVVAGAGVAVLGVGGALAVSARAKYNQLQDDCAPNCDPSLWEGYETRTKWGNVLMIAGGAAVVGGAALWFWRRPSASASGPPDQPAASAAIVPTPGGAAVTASGRF